MYSELAGCFVLAAFLVAVVDGVSLPPSWCSHIRRCCADFDDLNPSLPGSTTITSLAQIDLQDPISLVTPPIILWSPLEQFKDVLDDKQGWQCPKCSEMNNLKAVGWRDGSSGPRSEPRKTYGANGVTLLVGRVYRCSKGHEVLGYHPQIVRRIEACFVPFRLWHITGFTSEFTALIVALVTAGISIHGIRDVLNQRLISTYYSQKSKFEVLLKCSSVRVQFPSYIDWSHCVATHIPLQHAISGCFLADFWTKEYAYTQCMANTTLTTQHDWLSCDPTFTCASKLK